MVVCSLPQSPQTFFCGKNVLFRTRLVEKLHKEMAAGKDTIIIEGQAGQGKTVLAQQVLDSCEASRLSYQLSVDDSDPIYFLRSLISRCRQQFPSFNAPDIHNWLLSRNPFPADCQNFADDLLDAFNMFTSAPCYLMFDDIHLLDTESRTLDFLRCLITAKRKKLNLLFVSRQPVLNALGLNPSELSAVQVKNGELAFNRQEIAELFNLHLQIPITPQAVADIFHHNEGWIMGLLLAVQGYDGKKFEAQAMLAMASKEGFVRYFSTEVWNKVPCTLQDDLLCLALIDEIPVALAIYLTEKKDISSILDSLEQSNFFIRSLRKDKSLYSMHHLLQESLHKLALERKGLGWIQKIKVRAGQWYQDSRPKKSLVYFLQAEQYEECDFLLSQAGMRLLAENKLASLHKHLETVSKDIFKTAPWLSYFYGVVCLEKSPQNALDLLETSLTGFSEKHDEIGVLSASVHLIFFHTAIDCRLNRGQEYLNRATRLFDQYSEKFPPDQRANAANLIVIGLTFFTAELEWARKYADLGLQIALEYGFKNIEASARLARCYRDIFAGGLLSCRQEIDDSLHLLSDPQVSDLSKGTLHLAQLNLLANEADREGYFYHLQQYLRLYGEEFIKEASYLEKIRLWEIDFALQNRDFAEMERLLQVQMRSEGKQAVAHIQSMNLHYAAYLFACQGRSTEALLAAEESWLLWHQSGGKFFKVFNCALLGGAYARMGHVKKAQELFGSGLAASKETGEQFIRPTIYAHRAWLYLQQGDPKAAVTDIEDMLLSLKKTGFRSFYGWDPEVMTEVLVAAVNLKIMPEFAKELAANRLRLVVEEDALYPLLNIKFLGGLEIYTDEACLDSSELPPSMRHLLALLAGAPNHQLGQEYIQGVLWPEESPNRGRSSFDSLVSRLRKLISDNFSGIDGKKILRVQKGILVLQNCWLDIDAFRTHLTGGRYHLRRRELWQAGNELRKGLLLWQGEFCGNNITQIDVSATSYGLLNLFLDGSHDYAQLLTNGNSKQEAEEVLRKAIAYDPTNENLVRQLYQLAINSKNPSAAQKIFLSYKEALLNEGVLLDEVESITEGFWQ